MRKPRPAEPRKPATPALQTPPRPATGTARTRRAASGSIDPLATRLAPSSGEPPAIDVLDAVIAKYGARIAKTAVCLQTPVPEFVALDQVRLSPILRDFITRYEPQVVESGLYAHQSRVLAMLRQRSAPSVVLTTSTGSGKSLAFWAWAVELLRANASATVVVCFPTQALLWGQADRLRRISNAASLVERSKQTYAGEIDLAGLRVPWTVWHGTSDSIDMKEHESSTAFWKARVRVCTIDKVHWSLLQERHAPFLTGLRGVVVDEAHMWHGLAGANVRAMFDRMRLSLDVLGLAPPAFFLASATLNDATEFASNLTGVSADALTVVDDQSGANLSSLLIDDVRAAMLADVAAGAAPRRYVVMIEPHEAPLAARDVLGDRALLGSTANALCFVQSKFAGHRLRNDLAKRDESRDVIAYDGDMTAQERRQTEKKFFAAGVTGKTIVATNALEVGVDLPDLDVVVMDDLPPRRADLLQRLGRVGRRADRPGLALLCLGYSPLDARIADEPDRALSIEGARALPLPLHLDSLRLRMMRAAFEEWRWRLKKREVSWDAFNAALEERFGERLTFSELETRIEETLGDLVDLDDGSWFYKGFRVSASQGKRKLVLRRTGEPVAQIEDTAVFRDAHPEGVYLGHRGQRFRVVGYRGRAKIAKWTDARSDIVLGKFLHTLDHIEVDEERRLVATRGRWKDRFDLHIERAAPATATLPKKGPLSYGIWNFLRRFDGYTEIDLTPGGAVRVVPLADVAERFKQSMDAGEQFPFLHNFCYRTLGWRWRIPLVVDQQRRKRLNGALEGMLHTYLCDAVECATSDLSVTIDAVGGDIRVIDGTPGGNGLSEALLAGRRAERGLAEATSAARAFAGRPTQAFERYLAEECRVESGVPAGEVADALEALARAWAG